MPFENRPRIFRVIRYFINEQSNTTIKCDIFKRYLGMDPLLLLCYWHKRKRSRNLGGLKQFCPNE